MGERCPGTLKLKVPIYAWANLDMRQLTHQYIFGVWEETNTCPGRTDKLHASVFAGIYIEDHSATKQEYFPVSPCALFHLWSYLAVQK